MRLPVQRECRALLSGGFGLRIRDGTWDMKEMFSEKVRFVIWEVLRRFEKDKLFAVREHCRSIFLRDRSSLKNPSRQEVWDWSN